MVSFRSFIYVFNHYTGLILNFCSMFGDWHSLLPQSLDATIVGAQSQQSIMLPGPEQEVSDSPTSSPGSPCSVKVNPTG